MLFQVFLAAIFLQFAFADVGWDGIQSVSVSGFQCLMNHGFTFYIGRVWEEVCAPDNNGVQNIKNARAAGWKWVDGYIFPSHRGGCGGGAAQMAAAVNNLRSKGAEIGQLWLDIERSSWPADQNANRAFITDMINQAKAMGINLGVYTNYNSWNSIVGAGWTGASHLPIWWAYWDGRQTFNGFESFGGWTKVAQMVHVE
uniref:Lysozyme n=1 Tax=Acrobeloides nanus TaxID=290746 RepID=A0A914DMV7_9BILA